MHRGDRDAARVDGGQVGAGLVVEARVGAVDPVAPAAVLVLGVELELVAVDALAQAGDLDALGLAGGHVDVQQRAGGQRDLVELATDAGGELGRALEGEAAAEAEVHLPGVGLLGDGDAREAEHERLERGGDRARVGDVVAEVGAVVDAGRRRLGPKPSISPSLARRTQSTGVPSVA